MCHILYGFFEYIGVIHIKYPNIVVLSLWQMLSG